MATTSLKVTVPKDLDEVFNIDNFKFGEVREKIRHIYQTL